MSGVILGGDVPARKTKSRPFDVPPGATHWDPNRLWPFLRDGESPAFWDGGMWIAYRMPCVGKAHIAKAFLLV